MKREQNLRTAITSTFLILVILEVAHRVRGPFAFALIAVTARNYRRIEVTRIGVVCTTVLTVRMRTSN